MFKHSLISSDLCYAFREFSRRLHVSDVLGKQNHYDALGITPKATQNEVKSAYYKLSMIYHPDKNKDSVNALNKFRDITEAYEVLGNYKLRKLYDKGIIHTANPRVAEQHSEDIPEDDAETRFYKSRQFRHRAPPTEGATPIYNFDEWTRAHYGRTFEHRQNVKARYNARVQHELHVKYDKQTERIIGGVLTIIFLMYCFWPTDDWDSVQQSIDTKSK